MPETPTAAAPTPAAPADPTALLLVHPAGPEAPGETRSIAAHLGAEELALAGPGATFAVAGGDLILGRRLGVAFLAHAPAATPGDPETFEVGLPALAEGLRLLRGWRWEAGPGDGPLHRLYREGGAITAPALREVLALQAPATPTPTPAPAPADGGELPDPPFAGPAT